MTMPDQPTVPQWVRDAAEECAGPHPGMATIAEIEAWERERDKHKAIISRHAPPSDQTLHVLFDGPPGHEAGRFVEVENDAGEGVCAGEWKERKDGLWDLVIPRHGPQRQGAEEAAERAAQACMDAIWQGRPAASQKLAFRKAILSAINSCYPVPAGAEQAAAEVAKLVCNVDTLDPEFGAYLTTPETLQPIIFSAIASAAAGKDQEIAALNGQIDAWMEKAKENQLAMVAHCEDAAALREQLAEAQIKAKEWDELQAACESMPDNEELIGNVMREDERRKAARRRELADAKATARRETLLGVSVYFASHTSFQMTRAFVAAELDRLAAQPPASEKPDRPTIVCLCGSTRFKDHFVKHGFQETLDGKIVLTIGCDMRTDDEIFGHLTPDELRSVKADLDRLHLRKIDLADEVLILNVEQYIGESTGNELAYARKLGKTIRFLETPSSEGKQAEGGGTDEGLDADYESGLEQQFDEPAEGDTPGSQEKEI